MILLHYCINRKHSFIIITQMLAQQCAKLRSRDCGILLNWEVRTWDVRYLLAIWLEPEPELDNEKWANIWPTGTGYPVHPYGWHCLHWVDLG